MWISTCVHVLLEENLGHTLHLLLNKSWGTRGNIFTPVVPTYHSLSICSGGDKLLVLPVPSPSNLLHHHVQWDLSEHKAGNILTQRKAEKYSRFSTLYLLTSQSLWPFCQWQEITQKSKPIKSKHKHAFLTI